MQVLESVAVPTNAQEVKSLLAKLGFPHQFPREIMAAIALKEGRQFSLALASIANNESSAPSKREYVEAVCAAVSPMTMNALKSLGFGMIGIDQIIDISKQEGVIFRSSIRSLSSQHGSGDAKNYLERLLACSADGNIFDSFTEISAPTPPEPCAISLPEASVQQKEPAINAPSPVVHHPNAAPTTSALAPGQLYESYHIYGQKNCFCFSMDRTRSDDKPTIRVEAARKVGSDINWGSKVGFQLSIAELPLVYGLFSGHLQVLTLNGHGRNNEKTLHIEDQGDKCFFSLRVKGQEPFATPAPSGEIFMPMSMVWRQLQANTPNVDQVVLLSMIKTICDKYQLRIKSGTT